MGSCAHMTSIMLDVEPRSSVCEQCVKDGTKWVSLRMCLTCGHVGCCDSSPSRHATRHFQATNHPVITGFPDKAWKWCYIDNEYV